MDQNLQEILELSKENNKLLKKLWRNVKIGRAFSFLYWVVIIALTLGAYYYIQPYIESLIGAYSNLNLGDTTSNLDNLPDVSLLSKILGR